MKRLYILLPDAVMATPDKRPATGKRPLDRLLAHAAVSDSAPSESCHTALSRLFRADSGQPASLVHARMRLDGIDADTDDWFCADPVHLHLGLKSLTVHDSRAFDLSAEDAGGLLATLNAHFDGEIEFRAPHPTRWYARFRDPPHAEARPLDQVAGRTMATDWIRGPDATRLHRLGNEVQMALHEHPVNEARAQRGELPVSGLWFWGGGRYRAAQPAFSLVLSDDFMAQALAHSANAPWLNPPDRIDPAALPEGTTLLFPVGPDLVRRCDSGWFKPLLPALRWGRLNEVMVEFAGMDGVVRRADRRAAWRIWRG